MSKSHVWARLLECRLVENGDGSLAFEVVATEDPSPIYPEGRSVLCARATPREAVLATYDRLAAQDTE